MLSTLWWVSVTMQQVGGAAAAFKLLLHESGVGAE